MERRRYLLAVASLAGVAGCGGGGPGGDTASEATTDRPTPTPTRTATPTPTPTEPEFALRSIDLPAEVGAGEPFSWSLTVANTGDGDGVFRTAVSSRRSGEAYERLGEIELEIAAGDTETFESERGRLPYLSTVTFRFDAIDVTREVSVVPRSLLFYDTYRNPAGVATAADGLRLREAYTYETEDGVAALPAAAGRQWAFVTFEAANTSDAPARAPRRSDVTLLADDARYDSVYVLKEEGRYRGGEIASGVTRRGWIGYEVPAALAVDDLAVAYRGQDREGEWAVRWRADLPAEA